jgi:hypothetical protein
VLTRDRVAAEAPAIISASDAAALSMRTLAARLGVVPAALYRHVRSEEQLYDLLEGRSPRSRTSCGPSWTTTPASPPCLKPATPQLLLPRPGRGVPRAVASRWPARPRGRPGLPADIRPHQRVRAHRGHRQPRPGTGSPRRSPGDTVRLTHPNLVHARNASRRYGPAGSGSTTPPVAPRRGSRQIAGRAGVQIDRICTHNERTRHDSAAAPTADLTRQRNGRRQHLVSRTDPLATRLLAASGCPE